MTSTSSWLGELSGIAASPGAVEDRAQALLDSIGVVVPHAAGWIGVRDPEAREHRPLAMDGAPAALVDYFGLPDADDEMQRLGLNRLRPPVRPRDMPVHLEETRAWADYFLPAGFVGGLAMAIYSRDGRHLGFFCVLTDDPTWPVDDYFGPLVQMRPLLALAIDRLPSVAVAALGYGDVLGGAALTRGGRCLRLPGLPEHPLLTEASPTVVVARDHVNGCGAQSSFLCPWDRGLVRISVMDCRDERVDHLSSVAVVRPAGDVGDLDETDLEVVGGLVQGWTVHEIAECRGVLRPDQRVEAMVARLGLRSPHELVVQTAARGDYIPPSLWRWRRPALG
jgi:hypothetical protein